MRCAFDLVSIFHRVEAVGVMLMQLVENARSVAADLPRKMMSSLPSPFTVDSGMCEMPSFIPISPPAPPLSRTCEGEDTFGENTLRIASGCDMPVKLSACRGQFLVQTLALEIAPGVVCEERVDALARRVFDKCRSVDSPQ